MTEHDREVLDTAAESLVPHDPHAAVCVRAGSMHYDAHTGAVVLRVPGTLVEKCRGDGATRDLVVLAVQCALGAPKEVRIVEMMPAAGRAA